MRFDLLVKGGEVVDPAAGFNGRLDVAIRRGRIAAVDREIPAESAFQVLDASNQYVTPGLIDLHTHVYWGATYWGVRADPIAARTGVTTWLDAGSAGAYTLEGFRAFIVRPARSRIYAYLHISPIGLVGPDFESANPELLDVDLATRVANANRDLVLGFKVRMGKTQAGASIEPLRRAREAADRCELPLMVHISVAPPSIEEVFALLRPGDVLTHCFTGHSMRIVDAQGRLFDFVKRAWDAGVVLDIGHGSGSFSFETAEALLAAGHRPDVISTDIHQLSIGGPMFDLPTCLSKFLALGMSLPDTIRAATARPAEVLGLGHELGTLKPGAVADLALLTLSRGRFTFYDVFMNAREGTELLRCSATILGGRLLEPQPPEPLAPRAQPSKDQQALVERGHTPEAMAAAGRGSPEPRP